MSADDADPDADTEPGVSGDETGSDAPSDEEIRAEAREAVDTSDYDEAAEEMRRLLDADPTDPDASGDVTTSDFAAVGEDLGRAWSAVRKRYRRQVRERRAAAREAAEEDDTHPLAGTLAFDRAVARGDRDPEAEVDVGTERGGGIPGRVRAAVTRDTPDDLPDDAPTPRIEHRDGRPVVVGPNPLGPVEEVRLQQLADRQHQDVHARNESADEVQRGPRAGESDSPLVPKYHINAQCSNADFAARAYSRTTLADAGEQAVPCPSCVITSLDAIPTDTPPVNIRTVEDALDVAPAFEDLSRSEQQRVGYRTSGHNTPEKERHQSIATYLAGDDEGATAAEIAARQGWSDEQTEDDLETMADTGALEYRQGDDGRTVWRLAGAGA